ncbi:MAG TPA: hypothetical protein VN032_09905 [Thermoanaerobaculia bacterium]|nr:hypothetical protein [Thermoanaerobaculia bacterium]
MTLVLSLLPVAGALLVVSGVGFVTSGAFVPRDRAFFLERLGWSDAIGCAAVMAFVPAALGIGVRPGWIAFLVFVALLVAAARLLAPLTLPSPPAGGRGNDLERRAGDNDRPLPTGEGWGEGRSFRVLLYSVISLGVAVYTLRALTEPMWANDFIAIWGLKGKTIFGAVGYPGRLRALEFAHPEYPLGLPLLYAGLSFLTGRWDDHAMALLFPFLQAATLLVLFGWLRRRGASSAVAGLATAIVAWFEPLYSAFLTGMAEVPLAFGMLLFGTALADTLDETDGGAVRRLALASALIAATKNEGLFLAVVGFAIALVFGKAARWNAAASALLPALGVRALHLPWRSRLPLADLEVGSFSPDRVWDSLAAAGGLLGPAAWAGLALVVVLIAAGARVPAGNRVLLLAAAALAAYLVIPAFAVRGPAWLVETTLRRTAAALAPLLAAGLAVRFIGASSGSGTGRRASAPNPGPPTPSTRAS